MKFKDDSGKKLQKLLEERAQNTKNWVNDIKLQIKAFSIVTGCKSCLSYFKQYCMIKYICINSDNY